MENNILVIEAEKNLSQVLSELLTKKGYQVDCVSDGQTGLRSLSYKEYDLVVLDWELGDMPGAEILTFLRSHAIHYHPHTIALIPSENPTLPKECLKAGTDDFVQKPVSFPELAKKIFFLLSEETKRSYRAVSSPPSSTIPVPAPLQANYTILIVDDNPFDTSWVRLILEPKGWRVDAVKDGSCALRYCQDFRPDIILLDLSLGDRSIRGEDVLWRIKHNPKLASSVVLIFTACANDEVKKLCIEDYGADGYILKGQTNPTDLSLTIQAWLRRMRPTGQVKKELLFGPLRINLEQGQAYLGSSPVPLTPKEYNLLACVAQKYPDAIAWKEIATHVFGMQIERAQDKFLDIVETHITHIRTKLGPAEKCLCAEPGGQIRLALY